MGSFSLKQLVAVARSLGIRTVAARLGYNVRGRLYDARWSSSGARLRSLRTPSGLCCAARLSRPRNNRWGTCSRTRWMGRRCT